MKTLPDNVQPFRRTPDFTDETLPKALLKDHKAGVWGLIQVQKGELEYTIEDKETHLLAPGTNGVVEPGTFHHVKPLGPVSFFIEFYK